MIAREEIRRRVHVPADMAGANGQPVITGRVNHAIELGRNRIIIVAGLFLLIFGAIAGRIVDLSLPGEVEFARDGGIHRALGTIPRAEITDRNGQVIATNLIVAALELDKREVPDVAAALDRIVNALPGFDRHRAERVINHSGRYAVIADRLSPWQQQQINELGIPGLRFQRQLERIYPSKELFSHVVGYTGDDYRGLSGVEKSYDDLLAAGEGPLRLSLDLRVQHALHDELRNSMAYFSAVAASGVVLDVRNGEVLGLVSLPDFDPNHVQDPDQKRYFNQVTSGLYELGSTFKIFTTGMTLDAGLAALDDIYDATDPIRVSRFWIRDYHPERRPLSVTEIFLHSSNIGSAKMAMQVGARGQQEFLSRLGMFERLPIELPGAMVPPVPQPWGDAKTMTVAYGHGIAVSPLHLATGVASLVNGGRRVYPTILQRLADNDGLGERVISEATSLNLRRLLRLAVTSKDGTGSRADVPGYSVGGKTGTANKAAGGRYAKNAKLSSFVGIFPAEAPRYLVFVVLDEPQGRPETYNYATGGWTAAPAVGAVISRIAPILGVRPRFDDDPLQLAAMRGVD